MRREAAFGAKSIYAFIVDNNVLMHKEAAQKGSKIIAQWLKQQKKITQPFRVLDLACGGAPLIPNALMAFASSARFEYTGVDINADQVEAARNFKFAKNVKARILEEDAWGFKNLGSKKFDFVFIGLNTHHAVPEELAFLARNVNSLLSPGGLYINHDKFRPERHRYLPRPDFSATTEKSMRLISIKKLVRARIPAKSYPFLQQDQIGGWREALFQKFYKIMAGLNCNLASLEFSMEHVRERDFPVSVREMHKIFSKAGFKTKIHGYGRNPHPLKQYFSMLSAQKI